MVQQGPDLRRDCRRRFLALHEALASCDDAHLLTDPGTALTAIIVLDQMSRNMFRDTSCAFAGDPRGLRLAQDAIARGFEAHLTNDERLFLNLPFEHAKEPQAQARCVAHIDLVRAGEARTQLFDDHGGPNHFVRYS